MKRGGIFFYLAWLTPAFAVYTLFMIYPVALSAGYSLTQWNGIAAMRYIGLDNYAELWSDPDYWKVVRNTAELIGYSLVFQVFVGLLLAYGLSAVIRGFRFYRSVFFIPVIMSPVAIGMMFSLFYNSETGPLNQLLDAVGLSSWKRQWLSDVHIVLKAVMAPQIWQFIGLYVVIFLAAIQQLPEEHRESARIDGAGPIRLFVRIVLPGIAGVLQVCIVLAVTGSLKSFDHAWAITSGGPGNASSFIALQMFKTAFINNEIGYGSAMTVTILIYAVVLTQVIRKWFARFPADG